MAIELIEEPIGTAAELARIPTGFKVESVFDVSTPEAGGFVLSERRFDSPYSKDYDTIEDNGPGSWASRFDMTPWGLIAARSNGSLIGAAVVAYNTSGVNLLEGRSDLAVLWDIRILPRNRRQGVGSALFKSAEAWARRRGCRQFNVETQNINVPACRFYARQGCVLGQINRFAYPEFPNEIQLIWHKSLL